MPVGEKDFTHLDMFRSARSLLGRRRVRLLLNLVLLLIFLGAFFLGFHGVAAYEDTVTRSTFTIPGAIPVPVLEMRPASGETSLVAVVAHGFSGSKELMASFGVELARAGITTYLFDFPGHGESPVALAGGNFTDQDAQDNITTVGEVVDYVRHHNSATAHPSIALLGHSMGSAAIGDYSMQHASDSDLISTVLVSPVGEEYPTLTHPKNLLLLVGQDDIPFAQTNSMRMQQLGCRLTPTDASISFLPAHPIECGNPAQGTGRRVVVLAGLNHITILTASSTFQELLSWLHRVSPQQVATSHMQFSIRLDWLLLALAGALLAVLPLCVLAVDIFRIDGKALVHRGHNTLFYLLCLLMGIAAAIVIQYRWRPFAFVHVLLADYVGGYFFFTALVTALLFFLLRRSIPLPQLHQTFRQVCVGVLLAAFLYFTIGQLSTFAWQRFTFNTPRFWRFLVLFILILPIFLLDEGISRGYQEQSLWRGALASLSFKALLIVGLLASIVLIPGLSFLSIVLALLVLLFLLLVVFCTQLYLSGRAAIAAAVLSALLVAWSMSTSFPIT